MYNIVYVCVEVYVYVYAYAYVYVYIYVYDMLGSLSSFVEDTRFVANFAAYFQQNQHPQYTFLTCAMPAS